MIYPSSRIKHAGMWRNLRQLGCPLRATWIDADQPMDDAEWRSLWEACLREASECSALVLYASDNEVFKGALVEVGAALSHQRPVFYSGPDGRLPLGNLLRNPFIIRCSSLGEALEKARDVAGI